MMNLNGKRVLVAGACGFIGANLVRRLISSGAEVHGITRPSTDLWRVKENFPSFQLYRVDLNDAEALMMTVRSIKPEHVFHLASPGGHPSTVKDCQEFLKTNLLGTSNLLEALERVALERLIYLGSSLEYGVRTQPLKETDPLNPSTFRGVAKAAATLLCQKFARATTCSLLVIRPFSVYGYWEAPNRLIPKVIHAVLHNEEIELTVPGYRRDYIFIEDLIDACILAVQMEQLNCEIVNVGSGEQRSNEEVVAEVQQIVGTKITVKMGSYPSSPSDTSYWVADRSYANKLLGWEPRHTLQAGLKKTIDWFRKHPEYLRKG